MLSIPQEYIEKVLKIKEIDGKKWFEEVENLVKDYTVKFQLKNLEILPELTINFIVSAYSEYYHKPVILKIGKPNFTGLRTEYEMLKRYGKENACECLYIDEKHKAMILEKLEPGFSLNTISNRKERIKQFVKIQKKIRQEVPKDNSFLSYSDRLQNYFNKAQTQKYKETAQFIPLAWKYYTEVEQCGKKKYLLHGDLNPKNIIKSGDSWKVIDPQGCIGEEVVEVIKVMRDEMSKQENTIEQVEEICQCFAEEMQVPKRFITKVTFAELIRVNCWKIEENYPQEEIQKNIEMAKILKKYNEQQEEILVS